MIYNELGKTGLRISRIGLGGIPVQRITKEETRELLKYLCDEGVNYIDTARGYTVSEEYLGYALEGIRDRFVIATKSMAKTYEDMKADIETSLKNLRTDYIDLYQIHNPSADQFDTVCDGPLKALLEAKEEGRIGHIGITAHSQEVFDRALKRGVFETVMFPYNIVESQGKFLMDRARELGVGFIAMKPLAGGAIENGRIAMRYACADPCVSVVIPGMYSIDEARENISAAADLSPLSDEEQEEISKIRDTLTGNFCRRCNYCAPCAVGIQIPSVFLLSGYLERYGLEDWARSRYAALSVKASACIGCYRCESRCPYELPIVEMLEKCAEQFGE